MHNLRVLRSRFRVLSNNRVQCRTCHLLHNVRRNSGDACRAPARCNTLSIKPPTRPHTHTATWSVKLAAEVGRWFPPNFGQVSGRFRVWGGFRAGFGSFWQAFFGVGAGFGQVSGRFWAGFGQVSIRLRPGFGQVSVRFRAGFLQVSAKFA